MESTQDLVRSARDSTRAEGTHQSTCALAGIRRWLNAIKPETRNRHAIRMYRSQVVPSTPEERRQKSLTDAPLHLDELAQSASKKELDPEETVLYLGYGSNMSAETFRGKRNIKPISQINVLVPELSLAFNLPGIPYSEPCFGNVRYRRVSDTHEKQSRLFHTEEGSRRLIGVVYEVTKADFAHIIATEGGGASYQDVLVDCYALTGGPDAEVPMDPQGPTFKAHTLFSPPSTLRPDAFYAQPSPRYLNLIKTGAQEHGLPYEYQDFLSGIKTYRTTSAKQRLGSFIFLALWGPVFAIIFGGAAMFIGKDGKYPRWYRNFAMAAFAACWGSYDGFFKGVFGDGERTVEKKTPSGEVMAEKDGLIQFHRRRYGALQ